MPPYVSPVKKQIQNYQHTITIIYFCLRSPLAGREKSLEGAFLKRATQKKQ